MSLELWEQGIVRVPLGGTAWLGHGKAEVATGSLPYQPSANTLRSHKTGLLQIFFNLHIAHATPAKKLPQIALRRRRWGLTWKL